MTTGYFPKPDVDPISTRDAFLPCMACRAPTPHAILAQHGSRCLHCHDEWARSGPCGTGDQGRSFTKADKVAVLRSLGAVMRHLVTPPEARDDPRAWARTLRAQEHEGIHLRVAQRIAWRSSLREEAGQGHEDDAAGKVRTAELQRAAQRQVHAYLAAHPEAAAVGLSQAERDRKQRDLDRLGSR